MTIFALNPGLDPAELGKMYTASGRLQIGGFLREDCATALLNELAQSRQWRLTVNRGEQIVDFDPAAVAGWPAERRESLNRAVALGGRHGFQFRYETIRLPKPGQQGAQPPPLLAALAAFLSSPEMVEFLRILTGADDIDFADAHASRYQPGHFLTTHDDRIDQQGRRAAYVLNLTPQWRPDWGGLLLFYDAQGNIIRGFTPGFNILNIFRVPQPHSVSWVTPLAGAPRYAVTGWLRAGTAG